MCVVKYVNLSSEVKIKPVQKPVSVKCSSIMLGFIFDPLLRKKLLFFFVCVCIRYLVNANFHLQFHMVETLWPLVSAMDFSCRITHST